MDTPAEENTDLFECVETLPQEVQNIIERYGERYSVGSMEYKDTAEFLREIELLGYTFDYYLDNEPYNLRKK